MPYACPTHAPHMPHTCPTHAPRMPHAMPRTTTAAQQGSGNAQVGSSKDPTSQPTNQPTAKPTNQPTPTTTHLPYPACLNPDHVMLAQTLTTPCFAGPGGLGHTNAPAPPPPTATTRPWLVFASVQYLTSHNNSATQHITVSHITHHEPGCSSSATYPPCLACAASIHLSAAQRGAVR